MNHNIQYLNWTFGPDKIRDGNLYLVTSLLNSSLEVNVLSATVECDDRSILDFERNTPLSYYTQPDRPMIFRVQSIKRAGPNTYAISATSTLGLLSEGQHYGGIYTGQTAQEVIASICGTVPFTIKHNLEEIKLYGWLPIASPRDNLVQVLFAIGASLKTDLDGVLRIEGLWDGISGTVTRNDMYTEAAAEYDGKVTQVIVSEHQYVPWTEEKQLFEGTAQAGDIITFDEPMHSLKADGFSIQASGANWARVSAGSGVLSGKTYIHNTRQITKDVWPAKEPNVKTVKDATLVSLVNSQDCAQRLADYYRCRERVDAPVVYRGELPGDRLATYHPFDKTGVAACLESADITLSNTLKAQEKSLVGFVPKQFEQAVIYTRHEVLTGTGIWEVPEGTTSVHAVLIAGGDGGQAGYDGEDGKNGVSVMLSHIGTGIGLAGKGGSGGRSGMGGPGGKILAIDIDLTDVSYIEYFSGPGGSGGLQNGELGEQGKATTLTVGNNVYTTDDGSSSPIGYTDVVTGSVFAEPGDKGIDGAKGGDGSSALNMKNNGENVGEYTGGYASSHTYTQSTKSTVEQTGFSHDPVDQSSETIHFVESVSKGFRGYMSYTIDAEGKISVSNYGRIGRTGTHIGSAPSGVYIWECIKGNVYENVNNPNPSKPDKTTDVYVTSTCDVISVYQESNANPLFTWYTSRIRVRRKYQYTKFKVNLIKGTLSNGGGGAAQGADGNPGDKNSAGDGANATEPNTLNVFGHGGNGGNGGGGGAGGGAGYAEATGDGNKLSFSITGWGGEKGKKGLGSKGADGISGCIILYYGVQKKIQAGQLVDKNGRMVLDRLGRRIIM